MWISARWFESQRASHFVLPFYHVLFYLASCGFTTGRSTRRNASVPDGGRGRGGQGCCTTKMKGDGRFTSASGAVTSIFVDGKDSTKEPKCRRRCGRNCYTQSAKEKGSSTRILTVYHRGSKLPRQR